MEKTPVTWRLGFVWGLIVALCFLPMSAARADEKILGEEHWVQSLSAADGKALKIYVWEKRLKDVDIKQYAAGGKVALLAHGATISGRVDFDLQVPEPAELTYSLMDY